MPSRVAVLAALLVGITGCGGGAPSGTPEQHAVREEPTSEPPPATAAEELKRLEGEWKVVRAEPAELKQWGTATFKGDTVTFGEGRSPLRIRIDPTKDPKWINLYLESYEVDLPGLYKLDGDRLTLYVINTFKGGKPTERPSRFDEKYPGQILHFERVKKSP
jgi:uncharacterized protein (TIGR03067 family)